jgi:hypothetical protein
MDVVVHPLTGCCQTAARILKASAIKHATTGASMGDVPSLLLCGDLYRRGGAVIWVLLSSAFFAHERHGWSTPTDVAKCTH